MSILTAFLEDISKDPGNWILRGIMADWAEENNLQGLANCLRWMIRHKKRPYHGDSPTASWFNEDTISLGLGDPESDIPGEVYRYLLGGNETANHKTFSSRQEAEEAFHQAWIKAHANGWKP